MKNKKLIAVAGVFAFVAATGAYAKPKKANTAYQQAKAACKKEFPGIKAADLRKCIKEKKAGQA